MARRLGQERPSKVGRRAASQARSKALVMTILEAASQILRERGYRSTTTTLIAERAGVSIGSLYQYFPDKEAVIAAVLTNLLAADEQRFKALAAHGMHSLIAGMIQRFLEQQDLVKILLEHAPVGIRIKTAHQIRAQYVGYVATILAALPPPRRPPDPSAAAFLCVNATFGILHGWLLAEARPAGLTPEALIRQVEAFITKYLAP